MSVGRICCREIDLVDDSEPVVEAARRMRNCTVGTLIVTNGAKRPVGLITDRDLTVRVLAEGKDPARTRVGQIMTPDPVLVSEETPIETALALMRSTRCRRLPVTGADGAVVGIVALDDILALLAEEFEILGGLLAREAPHQLEEA